MWSLADYQAQKKDLGLKDPEATSARLFVDWIHRHFDGEDNLTQEMFDVWCVRRETEAWNTYANRVSRVRSFLWYYIKRGYGPYSLPVVKKRKEHPYFEAIEDEDLRVYFANIDALSDLYAAKAAKMKTQGRRSLQCQIAALVIPVYSRLLYSSGVRVLEIRMLRRASVNLKDGVIHIHVEETKGYGERLVALDPLMLELMKDFDRRMDELLPNREFFFSNADGGHYSDKWYETVFRTCWPELPNPSQSRTVATDFRHNYAIENLKRMALSETSEKEMFILSRSMGHTTLKRTKYYMHFTPSLFDVIFPDGQDAKLLDVEDVKSYEDETK